MLIKLIQIIDSKINARICTTKECKSINENAISDFIILKEIN
jgi:hypothetical protein